MRQPEVSSLARVAAFNTVNVQTYVKLLQSLIKILRFKVIHFG